MNSTSWLSPPTSTTIGDDWAGSNGSLRQTTVPSAAAKAIAPGASPPTGTMTVSPQAIGLAP